MTDHFRRRHSAILVVLILTRFTAVAVGKTLDTTGCSWTATSPNGQYIFVGLSPRSISEQVQLLRDRFPNRDSEILAIENELRDIHRRFPEQGMYQNDRSRRLVWTMREWVLEGMPTSDGERLVVPRRAAGTFNDWLLARVYGPQGIQFDVTPESIVPSHVVWMLKLTALDRPLAYPDFSDASLVVVGNTLVVSTSPEKIIKVSLKDGHVVHSSLAAQARYEFFTSLAGLALSLLFVALLTIGTWGIKKLVSSSFRLARSPTPRRAVR